MSGLEKMVNKTERTSSVPQRSSILFKYLSKMKGNRRTTPILAPSVLEILVSFVGCFLGITALAILSLEYNMPMLIASFGASAVLVYAAPDAPLAQPRNVFFGHVFSAVAGVVSYMLFGLTWWSVALGTALALVLMLVTKTTHPPGGATALFAIVSKAKPVYILTPVAAGAIILIIFGLLINNLLPNRSYPKYWI